MSDTTSSALIDVAERAAALPLKLDAENQRLKKELVKLYEREAQLLKYIALQDRHHEGTPALKELSAKFVLGTAAMVESDLTAPREPRVLGLDLMNLNKRYNALSKSKLGRLQLWYWRLRAGK